MPPIPKKISPGCKNKLFPRVLPLQMFPMVLLKLLYRGHWLRRFCSLFVMLIWLLSSTIIFYRMYRYLGLTAFSLGLGIRERMVLRSICRLKPPAPFGRQFSKRAGIG
jgi:hypothetical protein